MQTMVGLHAMTRAASEQGNQHYFRIKSAF